MPERPMVLLHVLAPAPVGGLERVVQTLMVGLAERGHQVHVAMILGENERQGHPFAKDLAGGAVHAHYLDVPGRAYLKERQALGHLCRDLKPDVVHTHGYRPDVNGAPAARAERIPTVTTVHGFIGGDWRNRFYETLQRRSFRRFQAVVAVSRPLHDRLTGNGVRSGRLHLIQNAWPGTTAWLPRGEARDRLGMDNDMFHVGWVGRLSHEKGADVLLEAASALSDETLQFDFVGDGPEQARLQALAARLRVTSNVRWLGRLPAADSFFKAFDVFVLSSRTEGTPMVLFEAMAAGVPIVTTRVGGVPDVVDETCALLVPPEDPAALAMALRAVREQPEAAAARAECARQRVLTRFSTQPWLTRYETLYREICS